MASPLQKLLLGAAVLGSAVALTGPAGAAPAMPEPTCGPGSADKAGDNTNATTMQQGSPNTDLLQFFWRYSVEGGKPKVTANLRVAELDKTVQAPYTAHGYTIDFTVGKEPRLLAAYIDQAGQVSYQYGHPRETTSTDPTPSYEGDTTGALYEGKNGIIEIELPIEAMKAAGQTLGSATIEARQYEGRTSVPIPAPVVFVAPIADDMSAKGGFVVAPCAVPAVPVTAGPSLPAATVPGAGAAPAPLKLEVTVPALKAKKVSKARGFAVKLKSPVALTGLKATLKKGTKTVGTGSLASLSGSGSMKIKVAKAIKKGTYALTFAGKGAGGQTATAAVAVRVK
jgi:hypothetical protein